MRGSHPLKFVLRLALSALAIAIAILAVVALWPGPAFDPSPPVPFDYAAARARVAALVTQPDPAVRPECRSLVLDHGRQTEDAYVLLHGLTNCPAQFRIFADQLYARGANVLVLRLPFHGFSDRMTDESAKLSASAMLASSNEAVNLAHGYGRRVIVIGLSVSGVTAAWLAQNRGDVDLAVVIAPFFAPIGCPDAVIAPLANLLRRLPNAFLWWDSRQKETLAGSPFSYPRFPTRALGETLAIGLDVFSRAQKSPPAAKKILLVTSPADTAISGPRAGQIAALWGARCESLAFPADWHVPHDCIDPAQPGAQIALVYPQLQAWIDAALVR